MTTTSSGPVLALDHGHGPAMAAMPGIAGMAGMDNANGMTGMGAHTAAVDSEAASSSL
ncbi:hypothetical protein [Streptomyces sp. S.PB5]|uniref:hypothetical protein n=1 Tax=Streptomyces sp. S.PB5 TaxID=3020844 RepID=UPI0025B0D601|nr:hypothetical protein [Streptomyces sp. S.PB5]MDN3029083.1 hypothetical protein [Streptomyces sp. S.PB5]